MTRTLALDFSAQDSICSDPSFQVAHLHGKDWRSEQWKSWARHFREIPSRHWSNRLGLVEEEPFANVLLPTMQSEGQNIQPGKPLFKENPQGAEPAAKCSVCFHKM